MWVAACALVASLAAWAVGPAARAADCEDFGSLRARSEAIWRLWPVGPSAAWAWTRDGLQRWDGCRWHDEGLPGGREHTAQLELWAPDPSDVWVAASYPIDDAAPAPAPMLSRRDRQASPPPPAETVLYRWHARRWRALARIEPGPRRVASLWGSGPGDVRVVTHDRARPDAETAAIFRWDGRRLAPMRIALGGAPLPRDIVLAGGRSTRASWFAGAHTVLIGDGRSWRLTELPRDFVVQDVAGNGLSDLWTVGAGAPPRALHFDGERWTATPAPTELGAVAMTTDGAPLARTLWGRTFAWDGRAWLEILERTVRLDGSTTPWAHCAWSDERPPEEWLALRRDGRGVATLAGARTLVAWDGARWPAGAAAEETATSVWESPAGEAWATTAAHWDDHRGPLGALLRWRDGRWQRAFDAGAPMLTVAGHRQSVWAAGARGTLVRCEGERCAPAAPVTDEDLVALWEMDGRLWLGGARGALFTWDDGGGRWERRAQSNAKRAIAAMAGSGFPRVMAADRQGLLRWDGRAWSDEPSPCAMPSSTASASSTFQAIGARGPTELWVSGWCSVRFHQPEHFIAECGNADEPRSNQPWTTGGVHRFDGARWSTEAPFPACSITTTPDAVWLPGPPGQVSRWTGPGRWTRFGAGTNRTVQQVLPSRSGRLWIVTSADPTPLLVQAVEAKAP